jgi:hypothetical protein
MELVFLGKCPIARSSKFCDIVHDSKVTQILESGNVVTNARRDQVLAFVKHRYQFM